MARILFDAMSLDDKPSGVRTRLIHLAPELARRGHDVAVAHGPDLDPGARTALEPAGLVEVSPPTGPGPAQRLRRQRSVYRHLVADIRPDVVSAETWPMPPAGGLFPVVHDLRYLGLRRPVRSLFERWLRDGCRRASRIHTDSSAVAGDLARIVPLAASKLDVVPVGVPLPALKALTAADGGVDPPFVVAVGHEEPRKDFGLLDQVAGELLRHGVRVVRAGRTAGERASRGYRAGGVVLRNDGRRPSPPGPSSVRKLGIVSDRRRDALYHHAAAVLVTSRFEGFGVVPLEALAAGAWVVATDIAVHREVLGDAADFFTPAMWPAPATSSWKP